jgi:hypothetical protein
MSVHGESYESFEFHVLCHSLYQSFLGHNLTLDVNSQNSAIRDFYKLFPNGNYKFTINVHDDKDNNVFEVSFETMQRYVH